MGRPPKFSHAPGLYKQTGRMLGGYVTASAESKFVFRLELMIMRRPLSAPKKSAANRRQNRPHWSHGRLLSKNIWSLKATQGRIGRLPLRKSAMRQNSFSGGLNFRPPAEVTKEIIDLYYSAHRSKRPDEDFKKKKKPTPTKAGDFRNTATAQGYVNSVAAFLRWTGNVIKITFPREEVPTKTLVVGRLLASELIALTARKDLRYVLYAGFYAGMRKAEIVMARPAWFDIANDVIRIPHIEESHGRFFETKSGRGRPVPLDREFKQFLTQEYTTWKSLKYMVHEDAKGERYRWDPRQPMETLFEKHGLRKPRYKNMARFKKVKSSEKAASTKTRIENDLAAAEIAWGNKPEMTMHTMRHSYGSHHVRRGVPIARVALWMGNGSGPSNQTTSTKTWIVSPKIASPLPSN